MRAFTRLAEQEHDLASRAERQYSILMVDIEHLKAVNDTYGHEAGSRAVKLVGGGAAAAHALERPRRALRRRRVRRAARRAPTRRSAEEVAQRIRNVVFATTLEVDVKIVRIKAQRGRRDASRRTATALQAVMTVADRAMYKDKELREPPKGKLIIQKL